MPEKVDSSMLIIRIRNVLSISLMAIVNQKNGELKT
jgi:hypothetical protein